MSRLHNRGEPPVGERRALPEPWHARSGDEIGTRLTTNLLHGLSLQEATARLASTGPNELRKEEALSPWAILAGQFRSLVIWVLIGAALVSALLGEFVDGLAIIAIVVLNAVLGFFQEYRAERAAAALARLTAPRAKVIRDGQAMVIPASEVVQGDVLLLLSCSSEPSVWRSPRYPKASLPW